jgi:transposase
LYYKGDPGKLTPAQVEQLKQQIRTGCFRNTNQIRRWLEETFQVQYAASGVKDLLRRIGASYHKVTGFLWKANPNKQGVTRAPLLERPYTAMSNSGVLAFFP